MLDTKRQQVIEKYLSLQENFKILCEKRILRRLIGKVRSQEEWVKDDGKGGFIELDKNKDNPVIKEYPEYYLVPWAIVEVSTEIALSLDEIDTEDIERFNSTIEEKIKLYSSFLEEVSE